jgi:hypothetical protein
LPAEAHRRPAAPRAKNCALLRLCWLCSSRQSTACGYLQHRQRPSEVHQQRVGLRQILQCVGQIRTGSFVQTLNQMSDLRRHGKLHGAMPTLLLSPSSRSQSSGASWIGSHCPEIKSWRISAECHHQAWDDHAARATNVAKRRSKLLICLMASSRSTPTGSSRAVSCSFASNRASSFNSSVPGTPNTRWLTLWPHRLNAVSYVECGKMAATK